MRQKLNVIATLLVAGLFGVLVFAGTALAAGEVTPDDGTLLDLARPVFAQITSGNYLGAAAFALVVAVALVKRYSGAGNFGQLVHSNVGGLLTTFLIAFFGAIGTATLASASWSWAMLRAAGGVGFIAIGGYTAAKILYTSLVGSAWYQAKAPAWVKAAMSLLGFVLDKPDAIKVAQKAGDAAVAAKPGPGAGKVTEVP